MGRPAKSLSYVALKGNQREGVKEGENCVLDIFHSSRLSKKNGKKSKKKNECKGFSSVKRLARDLGEKAKREKVSKGVSEHWGLVPAQEAYSSRREGGWVISNGRENSIRIAGYVGEKAGKMGVRQVESDLIPGTWKPWRDGLFERFFEWVWGRAEE